MPEEFEIACTAGLHNLNRRTLVASAAACLGTSRTRPFLSVLIRWRLRWVKRNVTLCVTAAISTCRLVFMVALEDNVLLCLALSSNRAPREAITFPTPGWTSLDTLHLTSTHLNHLEHTPTTDPDTHSCLPIYL